MKTKIYSLAFTLVLLASTKGGAQTFQVLHNFSDLTNGGGSFAPLLVISNKFFYVGTEALCSMNIDGSDFTVHHRFLEDPTNGSSCYGKLVRWGNRIYGTTEQGGGPNSKGIIFSVSLTGDDFQMVYAFPDGQPDSPRYGLVGIGDALYGTTPFVTYTNGAIFAVKTNGTGYTNLFLFPSPNAASQLIYGNGRLYGVSAPWGTYSNDGEVFSIGTNGQGYTTLHAFTNASDGRFPYALTFDKGTLYGTTTFGGVSDLGTLFALSTNGSDFRVLFNFNSITNNDDLSDEEVFPGIMAEPLVTNGVIFGTLQFAPGGPLGFGMLFSIKTNGAGFTVLHTFSGDVGREPRAGVIMLGQTLYGTTKLGGINIDGNGTIYSFLTAPPPFIVNIASDSTNQNVMVTGAGGSGYTYWTQATTNLALTGSWQTISTNVADTNGIWQVVDSLTNSAYWQCQTTLVYSVAYTTNTAVGTVVFYSTNIVGTNVVCDCAPRRFYRAAASP